MDGEVEEEQYKLGRDKREEEKFRGEKEGETEGKSLSETVREGEREKG